MNPDQFLTHYDTIVDAPDAVSRLRQTILELAVRGKLVPQDPNDEPASDLLKRVAGEQRRSASTRPIQRTKLVPIEDGDLPFEVPPTWQWIRLGAVAPYIQRGKSPKYAPENGLPVVSQKCVQWQGLDLSVAKRITLESLASYENCRFLQDGDLLWNSTGTGTIGRVLRIVKPQARLVCDSHVTVVRCLLVDPEYIRTWLRSEHVYGLIEERAAGSTNQVELTSQMAVNQVVPLAPLAEQHRIVDRVDELMAICDQLETSRAHRETTRDQLTTSTYARLRAPDPETFQTDICFALKTLPELTTRADQIKHLRQTILDLAVRGKLVPQDPNDEPASELLKRASAERSGSSKSITAAVQGPFNPPSGWAWGRFPELGAFGRGRSKHRPRNDLVLFEGGAHPLVQTGDVARSKGVITTYTNKYNDFGLSQSRKWPRGTLCITIAANIADSGILQFDACFPDSVVGFVPLPAFEDARYFEYFMRTAKANLLEFAPATAQKNINLKILSSVLIPIPPLAELHRILVRVDELMAICDQLEASLTTSATTRSHLLESLLARALSEADYWRPQRDELGPEALSVFEA